MKISSVKFVKMGVIIWAIILLFSCENKNPTTTQTLQTTTIINSQDINSNEVWKTNEIHIVTAHISINNAILRIEPGTLVKFGNGTGITVSDSAGLLARGTTNFIKFSSDTLTHGAWDCIKFSDSCLSDSCELINCIIEFGGSNAENPALVVCENCSPLIRGCQFKRSHSNGILFRGNCREIEFFSNTFKDCKLAPVVTPANNVAFIGMNTYQNNGINFIQVIDDRLDFDDIWYQQPIPLQFTQGLSIKNVSLDISPGIELRFDPGKRLTVSEYGALRADATLASIVFTSMANSSWDGIVFESTANNASSYLLKCTVQNGGQDESLPANIFLRRAAPQIINCRIQNSQRYGAYIEGEIVSAQFVGNYFRNNNSGAISIPVTAVSKLNPQNYEDTATSFIELRGGPLEMPITTDSRWTNFNIPFKILNKVQIFNSTLTIDPGTTILMSANSGFEIGQSGGLIADGSSALIVLRGELPLPGYWDSIYFAAAAQPANCKLIQCQIQYGGGNVNRPGMIYCDKISPTIRSCFIEHSGSYGIYMNGNSFIADLNSNSFGGNIFGNYFTAP